MKRDILFCLNLGLVLLIVGCKKQPTSTTKELSQAQTPEALRQAVRAGDIKQVQELIAAGVDLSIETWPDWTPLHDAAACGHKDIAELLIAKGAEIDARDEWDRTPLILALCDGYEDVAELLVAKGADINATDIYGRTPLLCAFHWTGESAVEFLIARGADINVITRTHTYVFGIFALEHKPLWTSHPALATKMS
jgi:ankyrin repeat protein